LPIRASRCEITTLFCHPLAVRQLGRAPPRKIGAF
jgi:hypothetical protein